MREELFLVLELREEKLTFAIVEGGKMDFFFFIIINRGCLVLFLRNTLQFGPDRRTIS